MAVRGLAISDLEATWGTAEAVIEKGIDIMAHSVKQNNQNELYRTMHSPYVSKFMKGPYKNSGSFDMAIEPENMGHLFYLLFGGGITQTQQGVTDAWLNEFEDADTIKHATMIFGSNVGADGSLKTISTVINKVSIGATSKLIKATWNYVAMKEALITMPSITPSQLNPFAGFNWWVEIGGAEDTNVTAFSLDIERKLDEERKAHSMFIPKPVPGDFLVSGKVDIMFENTTNLKRFWGAAAAAEPQTDITPFAINLKTEGIIADTPHKYQFNALMPRCIFDTRDAGVTKREKVIESLPFTALYGHVTAYNVKVQLMNKVDDEGYFYVAP